MAEHLFIISITLFAAGSLFALCFYGWQRLGNFVSLILAAIASCFSIATAVIVLSCGTSISIEIHLLLPIIEHNLERIDIFDI